MSSIYGQVVSTFLHFARTAEGRARIRAKITQMRLPAA